MDFKRVVAALTLLGAVTIAGGTVTHAYPPGSGVVTTSDPTPDPGQTFTATATNCQTGEAVTFSFQGATVVSTCSASNTATASFSAPTTGGAFNGTAAYGTSGGTLSFTVNVVVAGGLPLTGSSGSNSTMTIAAVLLASGIGIFLVAQRRRKLSLGVPS